MIRILRAAQTAFEEPRLDDSWVLPPDTVWIDLVEPTREEELAVERSLGVLVPTREEMAEIEASSRLYQEDGATFMTATLLHRPDPLDDAPQSGPLTFVLAGERLVTIRYFEPKSFPIFADQVGRQPELCATGVTTFINLMEAVVDRTADNLEFTSAEVESISKHIFGRQRIRRFDAVLARLGRNQTANNKVRDSLVSLARLISFAGFAEQIEHNADARGHLESMQRDIQSLTDHSSHLSTNITFLLDAALGMINIEQNSIIKIFSVAAVAFMPPTLVASIYGMNFVHMPELKWMAGYPMALCLMAISAAVPLWYFKRKGWL
ncbi:MAG TPA: magnesium transporter CorA family protein [Caulobacteraceae bacterium]|nr:magnesium transporter CorA family protein [Caulobacteraceae bacterium]